MVRYSEGSGESIEDAVLIDDVRKQMEGIAAEYRYIADKYGEQGRDWRLVRCAHVESEGRHYDLLTIELKGGSKTTIHFDVTYFYDSE